MIASLRRALRAQRLPATQGVANMAIGKRAKIARRYGLAGLLAIAMSCGNVAAQCMTSFPAPMTPWPTEIRFIPANPAPGELIRMELRPLTLLISFGATVTLQGQDIIVAGRVSNSGAIPPPPHIVQYNIGSYPAGNYQVRLQLMGDSGSPPCPEIITPLLVGPSPAPTSVSLLSSPWWLATLVAGLLALALAFRNRRRFLNL